MRKDVLEDAASQFVACTAGSSGMTRLETFPTHQAALSSASWRCRSRISARRATSDREMPSIAACSSAHAYRSGLTRTAITGCSCASFSDIGVAFRSYERCLSYKCVLRPAARHERAPDCPLHRAAALRRRVRFFTQVWMVRPFRHGVPGGGPSAGLLCLRQTRDGLAGRAARLEGERHFMDGRRRGPKMATSEGGHEGVHTLDIGHLRRILDIFEDSWPPSKMSKFLRVAIFEAPFGHLRQLPNPATAEAVFDWLNPKLCLRAAHGAPGQARVGRCLF